MCTALLATAALADIIWGYATPIWWWRAAPYLRAGLLMSYSIAVQQQAALTQRGTSPRPLLHTHHPGL